MKGQMNNILHIASLFLLVFSSLSIKAQTEEPTEFSLHEAQSYALKFLYRKR